MKAVMERIFKLQERRTTVRQELIAGLTTFSTMAYIIFVNPSILAGAVRKASRTSRLNRFRSWDLP